MGERRHVRLRDIVDIGVRPETLGPDHARQPAGEVIAHQAPDEIAFRRRSRPVDHAGIERDHRRAVRGGAPRHVARRDLGALIVVRGQRMRTVGRRQREKRRGVDEAREAVLARRGEDGLQPADVDGVELRRIAPPQRDQRGRVADRVDAGRRGRDRARIADVAVDRAPVLAAGRRAGVPREGNRFVPGAQQGARRWPNRGSRCRR